MNVPELDSEEFQQVKNNLSEIPKAHRKQLAAAMGYTDKKKRKRLTDIHIPATIRESSEDRTYSPHHFTTMTPLYIPLWHMRRDGTIHGTPHKPNASATTAHLNIGSLQEAVMGHNPYDPVDCADFNSFMRDEPARTSTPYKTPKESPANLDISADSRFFRVPSRLSSPHPMYGALPATRGGGGSQPPQPPRGQAGQQLPPQPSSSSSSSDRGSDASRRTRFRPGHPQSHDYLQPLPGGHGGRPSGGGGRGGGRGGRGGGRGGRGGGPPGPFQPGPVMPCPWGEFRGNPPQLNRGPPSPPGPNPPAGVQVAPQQGPQAFHLAPYHFDPELKQDDVPEWDGEVDTLLDWIKTLDQVSLQSNYCFEQLGLIALQ